MSKKHLFQLILLILTFFLLVVFIYIYNNGIKNSSNNLSVIKDSKREKIISNDNIIKNIRYSSKDAHDNSYEIISDFGIISLDNPDIIFMTNVTASIYLKDSNNVIITSKFADFNNKNYETVFYENVKVLRGNEKIMSQKLEFSLIKDLILISKRVIFEKPGFNLIADKVEIDLITKNSKIFMNDSTKKVIAVGSNK
tara:strand:+ start:70 stop:660 length:591 start_codon:yes stop_codon:yes gene_type:complete